MSVKHLYCCIDWIIIEGINLLRIDRQLSSIHTTVVPYPKPPEEALRWCMGNFLLIRIAMLSAYPIVCSRVQKFPA